MQSIAGGMGQNGIMMVIGALRLIAVNPVELIVRSAAVKSGIRASPGNSEDAHIQPQERGRLKERDHPLEMISAPSLSGHPVISDYD
jgi:hypothetical protein